MLKFSRIFGVFRRALAALVMGFVARGALALPSAARSGKSIGSGRADRERTEATPRSQVDFVPEDLRAARLAADGGTISRAADLCATIRCDDRAGSVIRTRVLAETGSPLSFEVAPKGRLRRRALRAAQAEEDWWSMLPDAELEELLAWRRTLGIGLGRLEWTEEIAPGVRVARIRNGRNVPRLRVWHPRALRKDWYDRQWYVRLDGGEEVVVRPGDGEWVILTGGTSRPWDTGLWHGLGALCLVKWFARDDWADFSEKFAKGIIYAKTKGMEREDRIQLRDDLRALGRDAVIVAPEGIEDFDVVQFEAKTADIYKAQIDLANTSMSITAIGTNLPTEVQGGAGTGATVQGQVRQDYLEADASGDAAEIREQVLKPWAAANFGDPELAPWPVYDVTPETKATIYEYHLKYQILTKNELRKRLGEAPTPDGDAYPVDPAVAAQSGAAQAKPAPSPAPGDQAAALAVYVGHVDACARVARLHAAPLTVAERKHLAKLPANDAIDLFTSTWRAAS